MDCQEIANRAIQTYGSINRAFAEECGRGAIGVAKYLLNEGADIEYENGTPLRFAAKNGHVDVVSFLLQSGGLVDAESNAAALCLAAYNGRADIVSLLLSHGADVHVREVVQHELAGAYRANGQVGKAAELLEKVVPIKARVLAEDHRDRLVSHHALAIAYLDNGLVGKATELLEKVVAIHTRVLADEHPSRLLSQSVLGRLYYKRGEGDRAVKLLENVVAIRMHTSEEDHPHRLASQRELANAYRTCGQVAKAVLILEHVVAITERTMSQERQDGLKSQQSLAMAYEASGQLEKALPLLENVVLIAASTMSEDHFLRVQWEPQLSAMRERQHQSSGGPAMPQQTEPAIPVAAEPLAIRTAHLSPAQLGTLVDADSSRSSSKKSVGRFVKGLFKHR